MNYKILYKSHLQAYVDSGQPALFRSKNSEVTSLQISQSSREHFLMGQILSCQMLALHLKFDQHLSKQRTNSITFTADIVSRMKVHWFFRTWRVLTVNARTTSLPACTNSRYDSLTRLGCSSTTSGTKQPA